MRPAFIVILAMVFSLAACEPAQPLPEASPAPSPVASASPTPTPVEKPRCEMEPTVEKLVTHGGSVALPTIGRFVVESHLATSSDVFPDGRLFPASSTEGMAEHLMRECSALRSLVPPIDCDATFAASYARVWTPAEGGKIGQGSVGNLRPSVLEEAFTFNMYWTGAGKPKPGTRFLLSANGRHVVAVAGYETGPGGETYLGGAQPAVFQALGIKNQAQVQIVRLKDQTLKIGPIDCGE